MKIILTIASILLIILLLSGLRAQTPQMDTLMSSRIDSAYQRIWSENKVTPSPVAHDDEFMRRVYLDLTGRIPTMSQATAFLESSVPDKRKALILSLLNSQEHAEYFASFWTSIFLGHGKENKFIDRHGFQEWFQSQIAKNKSWADITRSLVTAEGSLGDNPALNWYAKQKMDAPNLADDTARIFLGVQLGCARCHNHPHDQWKLEDFYGLAAFYSGLRKGDLTRLEKFQMYNLKRKTDELKNMEPGERRRDEIEQMKEDYRNLLRMAEDPTTTISAEIKGETRVYPAKLLLQIEPAHVSATKRKQLADWITSPENPFFAKAFVNRMWRQMMGKGFVNPVDDMSGTNHPSNPELLDFLARDFESHHYDIKYLLFTIANSRTYQLSSTSANQQQPEFFESGKVKMLNADQLLNSFFVATSIESAIRMMGGKDYDEKRELIYRYHVFLFDNDDNKGHEMEYEGTIPQALFLLNGRMTNDAVRPHYGNSISKILSQNSGASSRIEAIFLATLSRKPSIAEKNEMMKQGNSPSAYEDIFWALLNSNEFLFNH